MDKQLGALLILAVNTVLLLLICISAQPWVVMGVTLVLAVLILSITGDADVLPAVVRNIVSAFMRGFRK